MPPPSDSTGSGPLGSGGVAGIVGPDEVLVDFDFVAGGDDPPLGVAGDEVAADSSGQARPTSDPDGELFIRPRSSSKFGALGAGEVGADP